MGVPVIYPVILPPRSSDGSTYLIVAPATASAWIDCGVGQGIVTFHPANDLFVKTASSNGAVAPTGQALKMYRNITMTWWFDARSRYFASYNSAGTNTASYYYITRLR